MNVANITDQGSESPTRFSEPSSADHCARIFEPVYAQANKRCTSLLALHLVLACVMAPYYSTWSIVFAIGVPALLVPVVMCKFMPLAQLTRMAVGLSLQTFCAIHIYQMHGMPEMHFFFFTSVTAMIVYQDFLAILPGVVAIIIQHIVFSFLTSADLTMRFFHEHKVAPLKLVYHFGIALTQVALAGWTVSYLRSRTIESYDQRATAIDREQAMAQILAQIQGAERKREAAELLALRDEMTGLFNRRGIATHFDLQQRERRLTGAPLTLLIMDIDRFKTINDTFGHLAGDDCLKALANILRTSSRQEDIVGRFGGDEFVVLMPKSNAEAGLAAATKLCERVRELSIVHPKSGSPLKFTISVGGAALEGQNSDSFDRLLERADAELYRAKTCGRNRAVIDNATDSNLLHVNNKKQHRSGEYTHIVEI